MLVIKIGLIILHISMYNLAVTSFFLGQMLILACEVEVVFRYQVTRLLNAIITFYRYLRRKLLSLNLQNVKLVLIKITYFRSIHAQAELWGKSVQQIIRPTYYSIHLLSIFYTYFGRTFYIFQTKGSCYIWWARAARIFHNISE